MTPPHEDGPGGTISAQVARSVHDLRKLRGWSAPDLARRCAEIGAPEITANTIKNIESGRPDDQGQRRRMVTIDELVAFARALEVPPILLIFPLGRKECSDVFSNDCRPTREAIRWFIGERPYSLDPDQSEIDQWAKGSAPLALYQRHDVEIQAFRQAARDAQVAVLWGRVHEDEQEAMRKGAEAADRAHAARETLDVVRQQMRQLGFVLPELPDDVGEQFSNPLEAFMEMWRKGNEQ